MQVINLKLESNMKEEMLEAIYGTVERLEQKVDELSDSTKNAGTETAPAVLGMKILVLTSIWSLSFWNPNVLPDGKGVFKV